MQRFIRTRRGRMLTAASVLAMAAIGVTAAWAAIGDGGVVKTCVSKQGTWRPIDSAASCKAGETQVDLYSKSGADATFLGKTAKAADSDKLDGVDSTGFLGVNAKAADSDKLDGIDSSGFVQGAGSVRAARVTCSGHLDSHFAEFLTDFGSARFECVQGNYRIRVIPSSHDVDVWTDRAGTNGTIAFYSRVLVGDESLPVGQFPSGDEHAVVHAVGVGSSQVYVWDVALHGDGAGEHSDISVTQQSVSQGADDSG